MQNKKIKVGISPLNPFVMKTKYGYSGFEIDLWEEIARRLNIKYEYIRVSFNDLLGGVKNGICDIGFSGITINQERDEKFNFCHSYLGSGLLILSKIDNQKNILKSIKNNFLKEFFKILSFLVFFIFLFSNLIWFFQKNTGLIENQYSTGIIQGFKYILYSISNLYFHDIIPYQKNQRIFLLLVILIFIIIIFYYIIKKLLSLKKKEIDFNPQIIEQLKNIKVATELSSTSEKLLKSYGAKIVSCKKIENAFKKLENNYVDAVLYDTLPILYYIKENPGEFKISPKIEENQEYAIAIKPESDLVGEIDKEILKMKEVGFFDFLYKKWFGDIKI